MVRWLFLALSLAISAGSVRAATAREAATDSHKVKRGETLWSISRLHGVSIGELMDLNHLSDSVVRDGQTLKIPRPSSDPALAPAKNTTHIVAKGETFRSIARKYGLMQDDLERANPKVDVAAPKAGTKMIIPAPAIVTGNGYADADKSKPSSEITHTVTEKDTFYTIGKKYGLTEDAVAQANPGVNPNRLRPGSKLVIPQRPPTARKGEGGAKSGPSKDSTITDASAKSGKKPASENSDNNSEPPELKSKYRRYIVSPDETPATISEAFQISVRELYEMNGLKSGSPLEAGAEILVPASPAGAR
jgi:LysM repeat protein